MRLLLDTHTFLWWVSNDRRLSDRARAFIQDQSAEVFFSTVAAWEIAIKVRLGQIELQGDVTQVIPERIAANGFLILPVEIQHALRVAALPLLHRDPFDRLLIAQAQIEGLTILTRDPLIAQYDVAVVW